MSALLRPSFSELYLDLARGLARRSTCARLQVGCVIASADARCVFGVGYNGGASGQKNACDRPDPGNCGCLHAEDNAVINCVAPRAAAKVVYCTHLPCPTCAKRLVNLGGVLKVLYAQDYRVRDALAILDAAGIKAVHRPKGTEP